MICIEMRILEQRDTTKSLVKRRSRPRPASAMTLARRQVARNLSRRLPYYLTSEEAHQLIDASENERDRLFLRLLWETGVRVSEAIALRLGDVGRDGIRVLGKGSVERVVFVQDSLVSAILFHAQEQALERNDYLFSSRKGGHITKQRADQIIKATARRASLERTVHAHLFRHGYAIHFLNCSGRLDALQEQLGHRDINTTRIYLRLSDEDVKREVSKIEF
ncbi:MAG: tyrosine-type recombinase/integrase [Bacteroidetes bacterium]|nr:tyrosine-type recombinase/integrase [Bacteroidota bacterium]